MKHADNELKEASEHLYYEITMLLETTKMRVSNNIILHNCLIESFGIHARCLRDFLFNLERKNSDDMLAIDFLDNVVNWEQYISENQEKLEKLNKKVAKELAHLTYERVGKTLQEKNWPREVIANDIIVILRQFLKMVPPERLCKELIDLKNDN